MLLTREQLWDQVQRHEFAPVYVLYGEETYLRQQAVKAIAQHCFSEADARDFNETEFSLATHENLRRALEAAEQLPLMSERRLIRITDVTVGATAARDTLKEDHEPLLTAYFKKPSPTSVVIFIADDLNRNRKMMKLLEKFAAVVKFDQLGEAGLRSWAERIFKRHGIAIDKPAIALLASLCGGNVARLENEAEKLMTAALPDKVVTLELVEELVTDHRELDNFVLTNELNRNRPQEALKALRKILADGAEPVVILGSLGFYFRKLAIVKSQTERGVDRGAITRTLGVKYDQHDAYFAAARRTDTAQIQYAVKRIAETDLAIKTSKGGTDGPRKQLEMLVSEIASRVEELR